MKDWGAQGWADGEREILPGVSVVPTGGHSTGPPGGRRPRYRRRGPTLAFFGDLLMRPWAANPRWVTSFDDFPLDSVVRKAELFAQAADEDWIVVLSHEVKHPVGRLVARPRPLPLRADLGTRTGAWAGGRTSARAGRRGRQDPLDVGARRLDRHRPLGDGADDAVRVDEELGRQGVDAVLVEDPAGRVEPDRVRELVLVRVGLDVRWRRLLDADGDDFAARDLGTSR